MSFKSPAISTLESTVYATTGFFVIISILRKALLPQSNKY